MNSNLKRITDKTVQDLLQQEIILPSLYFESFEQNAKKFSVDLQDPEFEHEVSDVLVEELKHINNYMKKTIESVDILSKATEDAQQAIKDKDEHKLKKINTVINNMKDEINALKHIIYLDPLTKTYNRRWIYNNAISKEGNFKETGLLLFIDLTDCDYLTEKYGNLLTDNVILYIAKFLIEKSRDENIKFNIARYSNSQFILFITQETAENVTPFVKKIRRELANTTLKSKSGLMFKTSFNFGIKQYRAADDFQDILEKTAALSTQEEDIE